MANSIQRVTAQGLWRTGFACLVAAFLAVAGANRAFAQADQGAIIGVVTDNSGAVIPQADVTLTDLDTGLVLKGKTNASGEYFFSPIKTGNYTVSASAPNFETTQQSRTSWCTCKTA